MAKTLFIIKTYKKTFLRYPSNVFFKLVELPFQMFIYIFLWHYIFGGNLNNFSYMICYYLMTGLLSLSYPFIHIAGNIEKDIFEGVIANHLVRPFNYIQPILGKFLAWISLYSIIFVPSLLFVIVYYSSTATQIICFIIQCIVGLFVEFMTWYTIGLLALYTSKIRGILRIVAAIRVILSGSLIPLAYMPHSIHLIADFLPFKYYIFSPVNTLLTTISIQSFLIELVCGMLWIIFFIIASSVMWKNAVSRLEANIS